jgi:hypothetical protein
MPDVRKIVSIVEEINHEGGPPATVPLLKGAIAAVVRNPFAGRFVADIAWYMEELRPVSLAMSHKLIEALGGDPATILSYGKGAIAGSAGELEHAALWHSPGGYGMREAFKGTKAIVPGTTSVGVMGARLDVPLGHKDAAYVRAHFDAINVGVPDAPRPDEMVFILAMATGPRIHDRIGGLAAADIIGEDGLR